jgi:hypothetical protein
MKLDPREMLLPTVKSRSQALTWLRGALRWCAWNCCKPTTQPWPAIGHARSGPVHAAILASLKSAADTLWRRLDGRPRRPWITA